MQFCLFSSEPNRSRGKTTVNLMFINAHVQYLQKRYKKLGRKSKHIFVGRDQQRRSGEGLLIRRINLNDVVWRVADFASHVDDVVAQIHEMHNQSHTQNNVETSKRRSFCDSCPCTVSVVIKTAKPILCRFNATVQRRNPNSVTDYKIPLDVSNGLCQFQRAITGQHDLTKNRIMSCRSMQTKQVAQHNP